MIVTTVHYEDFKRFVTGTGIAPPQAFDPATGKPVDPKAHDPVDPKAHAPAKPAPKAGPKIDGAVYYWGDTPTNTAWGCCLVAKDGHTVVSSGSLDGREPGTFDDDFPDAIELDGHLSFS